MLPFFSKLLCLYPFHSTLNQHYVISVSSTHTVKSCSINSVKRSDKQWKHNAFSVILIANKDINDTAQVRPAVQLER